MSRSPFVCLAAMSAALLLWGCALRGQASDRASTFQGEWILEKSFGVTAPPAWRIKLEPAKNRLTIRSHWDEPKDGRYGLTLIGLTTPELVIDTTDSERAIQAGPFVLRYSSTWQNGNLITRWSTSEYMGSSFRGTWTHSVSKDSSTLTLDIDATSTGETSRARLIFRRA